MLLAMRRPALRIPLRGLAYTLLACYSSGDAIVTHQPRDNLTAELAGIGVDRTIEPRLSIPMTYRPCARAVPPGGTVERADCRTTRKGRPPSAQLLEIAARASAQIHTQVAPAPLRAAALIDLLWADDQRIPLERSIRYLRTAARLADRPAPVLTDLAAALLVRAERQQTPRDLFEAVEAADRALHLEPRSPAARFNLALGLDRLGLDGQAERAWKEYLDVDSTSDWAREVRQRSPRPSEPAAPLPPPADAAPAEIAAYAHTAPQQALAFGWDRVLGDWGSAVGAGSPAGAIRQLAVASELANALKQRGGDETLVDAVRAIKRAAGRPQALRALARAHREYAAGRAAYKAGQYPTARRSFERVIATAAAGPVLISWARVFLASTLVFEGRPAAAEAAVRPVTAHADTLRQPALAARARWILGTTLLRRGRYDQAIGAFRSGVGLFERAEEQENVGALQQLTADAEQYLADPAAEYLAIQRALTSLRRYRRSVRLHNLLYASARVAAADGFPRAAMRLQDEDVEVASRSDRPAYLAEARIARAQLAGATGSDRAAAADLAGARAIVTALEPGPERRWFEADLQLAAAATVLSARPEDAMAALDSAVGFFAGQRNVIRLLPALVARSEAGLALRRVPEAAADLDRALSLLTGEGGQTPSREIRASLLGNARRLVDRLVMLRLESGAPALALADLERARVSLATAGAGRAPTAGARLVASPEHISVDYALIGDTLLTWTISDSGTRLARTALDRVRLSRTMERVRASLELRADDPATLRDLGALYDWLVRPVESQLGRADVPLVLIADGEIAGVPFPALWDATRRRYLIEDHPLRFAASLRDARRTARTAPARGSPRTLLVANPAFDPRAFPGLAPLPGAGAEVDAIATLYPGAVVLAGPDANRTRLEQALRRTDIMHYAGHAAFDDIRPEQSGLILAPEASGAGELTAAEIARLDLDHLKLVVLSACETTRPGAGASGGFAGLAGALLAAGAGGVLGTLWQVDDALTLQLMTEFHRAYRSSGDGAGSLRAAQLSLLRSSAPPLRSPAAWAGFRYAGT